MTSSKIVKPLLNQQEALSAAQNLLEGIKSRAEKTDENRHVARETIDELLEAGLFSVVTPKIFGGSELGFSTLLKVTVEIASVCGSSGWVYGVLAGHSWLLNLFPEQAQREILGDTRALIATIFRLGGTVTEEDGGYRLTQGEGRFCSGIDFADWIIVGNAVTFKDGRPPEPRFFVIPRSDVEVIDDWHTVGMRGTGSRSIRVNDCFIPEHYSVSLSSMINGTSPGAKFHDAAIYKLPFSVVAPFSIVGAPMGMAKGTLDLFTSFTTNRLKKADELELSQNSSGLSKLAMAQTNYEAGFSMVLADAERIDQGAEHMTKLDLAKIPRNWAYAVYQARMTVNELFEMSGGGNIYNGSVMQRFWRDTSSAAQHFAFSRDSAMINFGREMIGKEPVNFALKKK